MKIYAFVEGEFIEADGPLRTIDGPSCGNGRRSEPVDAAHDVCEQVTRDGDLGHLEDDIGPVADDFAQWLVSPTGHESPFIAKLGCPAH